MATTRNKVIKWSPNLAYNAKNVEDKLDVFKQIHKLGFECCGDCLFDEKYLQISNGSSDELEELECFKDLNVDYNPIFVTKTQFINAYKNYKKPIELQLNSEYKAIVLENKVIVGCQEFTHKAVEDLYKLIKKINK